MIDKRTTSVLFTIFLFALVLGLIYQARRPLIVLIFSVLFAYLLEPLVTWFQSRVSSRTKAIAATYLTLAITISIFLAVAGPGIVQQGAKLARELPDLVEKVGSGDIAQQIGDRQGWNYETEIKLREFLNNHRGEVTGSIQGAVNRLPALAGSLLWVLLIPLFAVFVLEGKAQFTSTVVHLIERRGDRRFLRAVFDDLDVMLAAFIRAQLSLAGLSLLAYTLVLGIAGLPFAFPIAAIAGILEFIPLVGPLSSAILIMGIVIVTGYRHWLTILLFLAIWRGLQDYLNSPWLMGRGLKLHPFAVILGVLIFGEVGGMVGIFLSVPIMASLRIVWKNWKERGKEINGSAVESEAASPGVTPIPFSSNLNTESPTTVRFHR